MFQQPELSVPLRSQKPGPPGIVVGDNEPYSGRRWADFTLDHHAAVEGLPHLGIEVRQDLIATPAEAREWAQILAGALQGVLEDERLYTHRAGGPDTAAQSHAD